MPSPPRADLERVLREQAELFPKTKCHPSLKDPVPGFISRREVKVLMEETKYSSSPGYPLAVIYPTKQDVLEKGFGLFYDLVIDRIHRLSSIPHSDLCAMSARDKVTNGFTDPMRIFIKDEPYPIIKGAATRLIFSVSMVDEAIDRLLLKNQLRTEVEQWHKLPAVNGIGFTDEMSSLMWDSVKDKLSNACDSDVSGWDWCINEWLLMYKVELELLLIESPVDSCFRVLMKNRQECQNDAVIALSDGRLFKLEHKGVVKSGALDTGAGNGKMRDFTARLAGAKWSFSNGDDNVCEYLPNLREVWEGIGLRVKHINISDGKSFEFCSHKFQDGIARPVNAKKALLNLVAKPYTDFALYQYEKVDFRHASDLEYCLGLLSRSGWDERNI